MSYFLDLPLMLKSKLFVGLANSSTSCVWLSDHREDDRCCAWPLYSILQIFLRQWTLTNKAVGTIRLDLSKPPQRRKGTDPRRLWLVVGTSSILGPELAYNGRNIVYSGVCLYIFSIYCFQHLTCLCDNVFGLFVFVGCSSSVFIRRIIYKC